MTELEKQSYRDRIFEIRGMLRGFIPNDEEREKYVLILLKLLSLFEGFESSLISAYRIGKEDGEIGLKRTTEEINKIFEHWYPQKL